MHQQVPYGTPHTLKNRFEPMDECFNASQHAILYQDTLECTIGTKQLKRCMCYICGNCY